MKNFNFKNLSRLFLCSLSVTLIISCTDLEISETDSRVSDGFTGVEDVAAALDNAYNGINRIGDQANLFALAEVTTDAALIPTRGTDWGDNGIWRQLHQHNWTAEHQFILNTWNDWNQTQLAGSQILDSRSGATGEQAGHAHFIRALGMYIILDNFGQVPFRDTSAPSNQDPEVFTGADAVAFIKADLEAAISALPSVTAMSGNSNRANKAVARYLLAKLMLNKHVYEGTAVDNADMSEVISLVDAIAAEGYGLVDGYFDIFREAADAETIWWVPTGVGNRIYNGLHYNSTSLGGGGWNGFSTLAEYYDLFEGDANSNRVDVNGNPLDGQEERRGGVPPAGAPFTGAAGTEDVGGLENGSNVGFGFLVGQQYALDGTPLTDRPGAPLVFTREFTDGDGNPSLINNNERSGIRVMKYNPRYSSGFANHEIIFRYSDAHLMKAEAMMRSGQDATAMVNQLRTLRGATPLGSVSEQDMLDERGRELFAEIWRRNDMIRFGKYTRAWEFKDPSAVGDVNRNKFPIPASQLLLNPNLVQNPGY